MWSSALARIIKLFLVCLLQLSFFNSITAQPIVSFVPFLSGFSSPLDVVSAKDGTDRLFIVEQTGRIRVFKDSVRAAPFLDVRNVISTLGPEMGLLSLAFHPRYDTNRYFFIYYTTQSGSITSINLARIRTQAGNPYRADSLSRVVLPSIPKPANQTNHNGGKLNFGPDGKLYFGTGDGGSGDDPFNLAQSGNSLLGKMLRIDVDSFYTASPFYSIPTDNPFVSDASILDEIWAMGLRNPWRWSFDRLTNDVWIGDVGQNAREEVDFRSFANSDSVNYGWRCWEGLIDNPNTPNCTPPRYLPPIFDYPHVMSNGGFSITGGYVYRGTQYPDLFGYYLTADYVSGNQFLIRPDGIGGWDTTLLKGMPGNIAGFGESESGELYASSLSSGTVYRVTANGPLLPVTLLNFSAKEFNGYNELSWKTALEENTDRFKIEYANDGYNFQIAGEVPAMNNTSGYSYSFRHNITERKKLFYRLKMYDIDGKSKYSPIISVGGKATETKIYPTIIFNNSFNIISDLGVNTVKVFNILGKEVYINNLNGVQGYFSIRLPQLAKGTYIVTIIGRDYQKSWKIAVQ